MTVVDGAGLAATSTIIVSASFSAAPPDCSPATFNPPVLQSRTYPSVCTANKVRAQARYAGTKASCCCSLVCVTMGFMLATGRLTGAAITMLLSTLGTCRFIGVPRYQFQSSRFPTLHTLQEARTGRRVRLATNVTLSLPGAVVNITNIVLDKTSAGWKCECGARPWGVD